jgi:hypothetical protein
MSHRQRNIALTGAAVGAGGLASFFRPEQVLVAEAPVYAKVVVGALAVALWLCVLTPFWLPEVVPSSWPRVARTLRWAAGGLLVAVASAALLFLLWEPTAKSLWLVALVAAVFAARHIRVALVMQRSPAIAPHDG